MKINIIIAKRGRDEFLNVCLKFINLANATKSNDVVVYVSDDRDYREIALENVTVSYNEVKREGLWSKPILLNDCIQRMRPDFDIMSVIDVDMVYAPNFLDVITNEIRTFDYIVSHGFKLQEYGSSLVMQSKLGFPEIIKLPKEEFQVGPSQISINRKAFNLIMMITDNKFYEESIFGWGGDDSIISFISENLHQRKMIRKAQVLKMWYHLYHENANNNPAQYDINFKIYQQKCMEYQNKIQSIFGVGK